MVKGMNLVIVESPTKARTLAKFLGDDYRIEATFGHVRDLPEKKIGVKIDRDFEPEYVQTKKQKDRTDQIKRDSQGAAQVYLATDPDREGEAIAWHIAQLIAAPNSKLERIVFHEITERAIREALAHPRGIDMPLVSAQQARRILDRLVGYKLSPLLWKKVRRGLSAGRVQSVALRLIVERERAITAFRPQEYWEVWVELQNPKAQQLKVKLTSEEVENQQRAEAVEADLRRAQYRVESIETKDFARTPPPPFTTSTLQQAAANRLGWSVKRTMQVAQGLYEEGLISYHRTDSTHIAPEAAHLAKSQITSRFGGEYALEKPRFYKTKSKVAQEAHEAIRPTQIELASLAVDQFNRDQGRLYELIWKRFVACQMAQAKGESVTVKVSGQSKSKYLLQVKGETIHFKGWYIVENSKTSRGAGPELPAERDQNSNLPQLSEGERLEFVDLTKEQKFTQPPARYNDASLIKTLEEMAIGRPSTYAPIISTILERLYVEKIEKRFVPTSLGIAVNDFLVANFAEIVDYDFTAKMEGGLDEIAVGKKEWRPLLRAFYEPFEKKLETVTETARKVQVQVEETGNACPKCGLGKEVIRLGRFGKFLACSRFPDCDYKANYRNKTGQICPKCGQGDVVVKRTRSRKSFYGCSRYPDCDFASWTKPK